jgi:peptidyl-prolyl cis-trans isomerase D
MDNLAFEQPNDLKGIQSALGLTVETADEVTRDQGPAPFDDSAVREALFADEVLENGYNSAASEFADGRAIVVRVRQRHEPEAIPFEDVAASIRDAVETERAQELAIAGLEAGREKLESGASAAEVARTVSGNWQRFEAVRRNATEVPRTVVQTAFDLPRPAENDKQVGTALLPSGGSALVTETRVRDGDVQALTEAEVSSMESFLADRLARLEFAGLFETVRADASISRPEL